MISSPSSPVSVARSPSFFSATSSPLKKGEISRQERLIEKVSDLTTMLHDFENFISPRNQTASLRDHLEQADLKLIALIQTKNQLWKEAKGDLFSRGIVERLGSKIALHIRNLPKNKKQQLSSLHQHSMSTFSALSSKERQQIEFLVSFSYDE